LNANLCSKTYIFRAFYAQKAFADTAGKAYSAPLDSQMEVGGGRTSTLSSAFGLDFRPLGLKPPLPTPISGYAYVRRQPLPKLIIRAL